ncbi:MULTISPECIES: bisanhydrobacterioruberin hydratase [unclassified Haladaptatus]|uniref:bisanhydrobacterioruberin hydratase n=1 Tax=unclassified Haladaptatus TaxID=2622732 RepID=UPI0023E7C38B|nr:MULTISPECIES: bisanhydrobacterioruberin hydratase [unclassified Haladaptatus]
MASEQPRRTVSDRLDSLVHHNRFTIAVVFPLVGTVLLILGSEGYVPSELALNPFLLVAATFVMRLPLIAGLMPLVTRRAATALLALATFTYAIELVGVRTGLPYGEFSYQLALGPMLFGEVPLALPIFYFPLLLNGYLLGLLLLGPRATSRLRRVLTGIALVLVMDLVLDPAAVDLGFWAYADGGAYYDVPVSNYLGWVFSATVAMTLVDLGFDAAGVRARLDRCSFMLDDLVSFAILWGVINGYFGNWIPAALAVGFAVVLMRLDRFDFVVGPPAFNRWTKSS